MGRKDVVPCTAEQIKSYRAEYGRDPYCQQYDEKSYDEYSVARYGLVRQMNDVIRAYGEKLGLQLVPYDPRKHRDVLENPDVVNRLCSNVPRAGEVGTEAVYVGPLYLKQKLLDQVQILRPGDVVRNYQYDKEKRKFEDTVVTTDSWLVGKRIAGTRDDRRSNVIYPNEKRNDGKWRDTAPGKTSHRVYYVAQSTRANPNVRFDDPNSGVRLIQGVLAMQPYQADDYVSDLYSYKILEEDLSPTQMKGLSEQQIRELEAKREVTYRPMPYVQLRPGGKWLGSKIMRRTWIEISALCSAGTSGLGRMLMCYALTRANWMKSKSVVFALLDRPSFESTFNLSMIRMLQSFGFREVTPYYIHAPSIANYENAKTLQHESVEKIKAAALANRQRDAGVIFGEARRGDLRGLQADRLSYRNLSPAARRYGFEAYVAEEEVDGRIVNRDYQKWFVLERDPETNLFFSFEQLRKILGVTEYRVPTTPYCGGAADYLERGYGPGGNQPPPAKKWRQQCGTRK